jgi:hypothetical protein
MGITSSEVGLADGSVEQPEQWQGREITELTLTNNFYTKQTNRIRTYDCTT